MFSWISVVLLAGVVTLLEESWMLGDDGGRVSVAVGTRPVDVRPLASAC